MQQNKGYSIIFVILILVALIVLVSGASYYLLQSTGQAPALPVYNGSDSEEIELTTEEVVVTDEDDIDTLELEFNSTIIGDPDTDLNELESDSSSL